MYVDRSRLFTRLLVGLCFCIWCIVAFQISAFAYDTLYVYDGNPYFDETGFPSSGDYFKYNGVCYKLGTMYQSATGTNCSNPGGIFVYSNPVRLNFVRKIDSCTNQNKSFYATIVSQSEYDAVASFYQDSDLDGLNDIYDPCANTSDSKIDAVVTSNACTGQWLRFTVFGSCFDESNPTSGYKTYYNKAFTETEAKSAIQLAKDSGCYGTSLKVFTPSSLASWWGNINQSYNSTVIPVESAEVGNYNSDTDLVSLGNNTASPTEASDDPEMNKVLKQIDRLQQNLTKDLSQNTQRITDAIGSGTSDIVTAINGLGSDIGVQNAVGSAASTAHSDSEALLAAVQGLKLSTNSSTSVNFDGVTNEELQTENNRIYAVDGGTSYETSAPGFSGALIGQFTSWTNTLQGIFAGLLPDFSVTSVNPSPCLGYGGSITDAQGNQYVLTDYCFSDWEPQIEMIGNMLLAFVSIGCCLAVFKIA